MQTPRPPLEYRYRFSFPDGTTREFTVTLDGETLAILGPATRQYPPWTALAYRQCANCPLDPRLHPRCPIAARMVDAVEFLKDWRSFDTVDVEVEARSRLYAKRTTLQEAAAALLGIYMVASGCPILDRLRPMLATHLPFMDTEESTYRTIAMYLMAQYFLYRSQRKPDWDLEGLRAFLRDCRDANSGYTERVRSVAAGDAVVNALALLNVHGEMTSLSLETGDLAYWHRIFTAHYR